MVARKILENWIYWIIIDIVSIQLYIGRELYLTGLLFLIYTVIAIYGYFTWVKRFRYNENKIILTGPECSGKTTLCNQLKIYFKLRANKEFARSI